MSDLCFSSKQSRADSVCKRTCYSSTPKRVVLTNAPYLTTWTLTERDRAMDSSRATAMQMQLRHNTEDLQDFLRDLETWESEIKEKDNSLKKQKPILKEVILLFPATCMLYSIYTERYPTLTALYSRWIP